MCQWWNIWLSRRCWSVQIDYCTIFRFFRLRDPGQDFARVLLAHLLLHRLRFWRGKFDLPSPGYFRSVAHYLRSLLHIHVLLMSLTRPDLRIPANNKIRTNFSLGFHGHLPRLCHLRLSFDVPAPRDTIISSGNDGLIDPDLVVFHVCRSDVPSDLRHKALLNPHWRIKWIRLQWRRLIWRSTRCACKKHKNLGKTSAIGQLRKRN